MIPFKKRLSLCLLLTGLVTPGISAVQGASVPAATAEGNTVAGLPVDLSSFGPIKTAAEATRTLEAAIFQVQAGGGGVILIPANAPAGWQPFNHAQEIIRTPQAPAPATQWSAGPGVTLFDARNHRVILPPVSGMSFVRTFSLPPGDSSPHWNMHPLLPIRNNVIRGTSNYAGVVLQAVTAGKDQHFYMEPMQGIFPGQILEVSGGPANSTERAGMPSARVQVKKLGYDIQKRRGYLIADAGTPVPAGATLSARTTASIIKASTRANNELQTFDFYNIREHYSQGDSYLYHGRIFYMGNEYSPREEVADKGAEARSGYGSVIYDARIIGETNIFRATVEAIDPAKNEVRYKEGRNTHTLATGRPLINLNPRTWITEGSVYILPGAGTPLGWMGDVRSADAPWTSEVVGRYIALDEPSEYVPTGDKVRRWYRIIAFKEKDGIRQLSLQRFWWGAKGGSVGRLYNPKNYSGSDHNPVLLKYIIAPGAEIYDVADGVRRHETESGSGGKDLIRIAPYAQSGTPLDFRKGDPVEQAIGPDPFHPIPFRSWLFDQIPGEFPAPVFDVFNGGTVARSAVLSVQGKSGFNGVVLMEGVAGNLLRVRGGAENLMVLHRNEAPQNGLVTAIEWKKQLVDKETKKSRNVTGALALSYDSGAVTLNRPVDLRGSGMTRITGVAEGNTSRSDMEREQQFRAIGVSVPWGSTGFEIKFPTAHKDSLYAVKVQPNWPTEHAVISQSADGFKVQFDSKAPSGARINWIVIR